MSKRKPVDVSRLNDIITLRKQKATTLAAEAGVAHSTVTRAIADEVCSSKVAEKLAAVLSVAVDDLGSLESGSPNMEHPSPDIGSFSLNYGKFLVGQDAIYQSAERLVVRMRRQIKIVVTTNAPRAPDEFTVAIAKRLREIQNAGLLPHFSVAMVVNREEFCPEKFLAAADERARVLQDHGVSYGPEVRILEVVSKHASLYPAFDVLAVDGRHAQIGFATKAGTGQIFSAIEFTNQPRLVTELGRWFHSVFNAGVPARSYLEHFARESSASLSDDNPRVAVSASASIVPRRAVRTSK